MKRFAPLLLCLCFAAPAFGTDPAKPRIVSLNPAIKPVVPDVPPVVPPTPPPGPMCVTSGKTQVLKLDGYSGPPVAWNVIQPLDDGGVPVEVVAFGSLPKGSPMFGFLEGDTGAKIWKFDSDALCLVATGKSVRAVDYVTVQAVVVEANVPKVLTQIVLQVKAAQPPPHVDPVTPPTPVDPPKPVTSFKVLLVYDSGATLTAAQQAVVYGKAVEDYLTSKCTGGKAGWGRRAKTDDPAGDSTPLKDLWSAVQPKVTSTPLIAIAVNDKVVLEPIPATPAATTALLDKYFTGGK